jgi:RNA polymerase sigma-70 factor (ECF subfamily)
MREKPTDTNREDLDEEVALKRITSQQDKKALAFLYVKYHLEVKRYITARVGCVQDAEDLTQDVFMEISKGKGNYEGRGSVKGYLLGVARKIICHYHKRKLRSGKTTLLASIHEVSRSYDNQHSVDPVSQVVAREIKVVIEDTIARLPPKAREAIRLWYNNNLNLKRSAEEAGCSAHTFCQRVGDAKRAMREYRGVFEDK